jgi:hypothetical protein
LYLPSRAKTIMAAVCCSSHGSRNGGSKKSNIFLLKFSRAK